MSHDATREATDHWTRRKISLEMVIEAGACYFDPFFEDHDWPETAQMRNLISKSLPLTLMELLDSDWLPIYDKFWVVSKFGPVQRILDHFHLTQFNPNETGIRSALYYYIGYSRMLEYLKIEAASELITVEALINEGACYLGFKCPERELILKSMPATLLEIMDFEWLEFRDMCWVASKFLPNEYITTKLDIDYTDFPDQDDVYFNLDNNDQLKAIVFDCAKEQHECKS